MAGRIVAVVLTVVAAGVVGVLAGSSSGGRCSESRYSPDVPPGNDSTVWLYVFRLQPCIYHSGIGTQGGYWIYGDHGDRGVLSMENYAQDKCNGALAYWYRLGWTNKTKEEVQAIVNDLMNFCYDGRSDCWKFISSDYHAIHWNCHYFTHHLATALGMDNNYPQWIWNAPIRGFHC